MEYPLPVVLYIHGGGFRALNKKMNQALVARGVHTVKRVYSGEPHAFHALIFCKAARECWREMLAFMDGPIRADG